MRYCLLSNILNLGRKWLILGQPIGAFPRSRSSIVEPLIFCHSASQVKLLLPKFHRKSKYNNTAPFGGGCWVSLTGRFHRHSAAGWPESAVAGPGRVCRHAAQFSERSSAPLISRARVALSGVHWHKHRRKKEIKARAASKDLSRFAR